MLPKARYVIPVLAEEEGCIERILAQDIGIACMTLGGGRENKESTKRILSGAVDSGRRSP